MTRFRFLILKGIIKHSCLGLAGVAQRIEHHEPVNHKAAGLVPSQRTHPGCQVPSGVQGRGN